MEVRVDPATRVDQPVLRHLMQLYLHDFSEILGTRPGADGLFPERRLDSYWSEDERHPFVLRADDGLAGFALVRTVSMLSGASGVADMTEFFVLRGLRRRGVGGAAAHALFERFPGPWEVRVVESYAAARAFWSVAIGSSGTGGVEHSTWVNDAGLGFSVFRFESGGGAAGRRPR